ncbi:uncharacterized protein LOC116768412 [Danaus plexippus]|uniref:uncharacterized protein LOC116768412 n=1 Tax=Danaus plexippus TaxID=13037 RepID=UPI002AB1A41F|nr:uncharacterized protein LOC116768412 [Danaus plexippus]
MKKVRFESPLKTVKMNSFNDSECHTPRPYIEKHLKSPPDLDILQYRIPFTNDPVQRFEYGDSSPYPTLSKTSLTNGPKDENRWSPSHELDLSILDCSHGDSRKGLKISNGVLDAPPSYHNKQNILSERRPMQPPYSDKIKQITPPNILMKNDDFFLKKENLQGINSLHKQMNKLYLGKENDPMLKKTELMNLGALKTPCAKPNTISSPICQTEIFDCKCYHCVKNCHTQHYPQRFVNHSRKPVHNYNCNVCECVVNGPQNHFHCPCNIQSVTHSTPTCSCNNSQKAIAKTSNPQPSLNAVDKKTWLIEKYGQNNKTDCQDLQTQNSIVKDKREPTVADLFKIIKLQNEQLQLLQEKVDKFISTNKNEHQNINQPMQNYVTEHVALESVGTVSTEQKISIGVMTSFEMVRTSTIINKEIVTQNEAQIQCNRSQISIKEVVAKQPVNQNFLEGLKPMVNDNTQSPPVYKLHGDIENGQLKGTYNKHDEKTLNEMSLYNVQVDNAITPNMSPEQSLYLDVRDYSDSDASSDDQSNVGWTYYNKVMTHVNGMLQDSDMPSSASALYRNARQKCLQMQIDKTNVSVAKRVTFGEDVALNQAQLPIPTTDTSLKMNQLAAKYLKNNSAPPTTRRPDGTTDMSLATRNYMEKHNIPQGKNNLKMTQHMEMPKFLDITALKQQPKFL